MIVDSNLVHIKVHVFPTWIVDCEESIIFSVIGNSELALDVLQCQNIGDGSFIELYLTISLYIGFVVSLNGSNIPFYCHGLICFPESYDKPLVTE